MLTNANAFPSPGFSVAFRPRGGRFAGPGYVPVSPVAPWTALSTGPRASSACRTAPCRPCCVSSPPSPPGGHRRLWLAGVGPARYFPVRMVRSRRQGATPALPWLRNRVPEVTACLKSQRAVFRVRLFLPPASAAAARAVSTRFRSGNRVQPFVFTSIFTRSHVQTRTGSALTDKPADTGILSGLHATGWQICRLLLAPWRRCR
jgi:hypothetical protein